MGDYVQIPQEEDHDETNPNEGESYVLLDRNDESGADFHHRSDSSPRRPRTRRPSKIDLRSVDNAFKRWTTEITQKVRRKKRSIASEDAGPCKERDALLNNDIEEDERLGTVERVGPRVAFALQGLQNASL